MLLVKIITLVIYLMLLINKKIIFVVLMLWLIQL